VRLEVSNTIQLKMPPKKVDKKSGKAEKAPAKPEKAKPKYKKPTPMPPDIREAMGKPIPTRTSASTRNSLFPYLALGFTPVETSARGWLCGVNALWRSYRNARDALKSPDDEPIKHATQKVFQGLLRSKEYADVFKEHLLAWQDPFMTDEFINEQIDNSRLPNNFDITTVSHILGAANR
jgi:hypothetical protein